MSKRKIVIILIALGFISFLVISLVRLKETASPIVPFVTPAIPSPLLTKIPWQIYSNMDYKYSISYPPEWKVEAWDIKEAAKLTQLPDGSIWHQAKFKGEKGSFEVLIWENKTKAPLRSWLSWFRHEDLDVEKMPEKENFEVGGKPAILYSRPESPRGKPLDHIFFPVEDKIFEFVQEKEVTSSGELMPLRYEQMVSSFRFLEDEMEVEPKAENLVSLAKEDLSQKVGVKSQEIRVLNVEAVDWPDTSLGCPKEGMFYAQVITPGYKITLEGGGKAYTYHSNYKRVVLCEDIE